MSGEFETEADNIFAEWQASLVGISGQTQLADYEHAGDIGTGEAVGEYDWGGINTEDLNEEDI